MCPDSCKFIFLEKFKKMKKRLLFAALISLAFLTLTLAGCKTGKCNCPKFEIHQ